MDVPYRIAPGLVRGLDYYTRTLFEISSTAGELGTQNALCGGGRYDKMVEGIGGPVTPAVGFALGIERVLLAMPQDHEPTAKFCYFAPMGDAAIAVALKYAQSLRRLGHRVEVDSRGQRLKSMLRRADSMKASTVVVLGDTELERGVAAVKDLEAHSQVEVSFGSLIDELARRLGEQLGRVE